MRSLGAIGAGVIAAIATAMAVAGLGGLFWPIPSDPAGADQIARLASGFAAASTPAQLVVAASWLAGGFVAALVARLIAGTLRAAWSAAGIFAVFTMLNIFVLPLPGWMQVGSIVLPLVGCLAANHVGSRPVMDAEAGADHGAP